MAFDDKDHDKTRRESEHPKAAETEWEHHDEPMPEGEEQAPPLTRTMSIVRWVLVALAALAAAGSLAYGTGLLGASGIGSSQALYICPMHPSVVQDHPGACPICGMDLVPATQTGEGAKASEPAAVEKGHEGHRHEPHDPYYCPMHPLETAADPSPRCPECNMKLWKREPGAPRPKWIELPPGHENHRHNPNDSHFCPMHPEESGAEASDRCPVCNMALEKRDPARAAPPPGQMPSGMAPVELTPERVQLLGMKTARVERAPLAPEVRTVGVLTAPEDGLSRIQPRYSGWIEELPVAQTGQLVEKGQVLATLYSPELLAAQQEYLNARGWEGGDLAGGLKEAARRKLELLGVSRREIAELERSGKPARAVKLRSPVRGYVVQKTAQLGLFVQPGTELFQVADLSRIWVLADLYEHEMARVALGQRARLGLAAYPGEQFEGRVEFLSPTVDPETRTLRARVAFPNPRLRLKPGMYGDVVIETGAVDALSIPREALVDTGTEQYVFVARPGGRFEPRRVAVGLRAGERVQVLRGVAEGETVVTTGNFLIDSESRLRAAIQGMQSAHDHGSTGSERH